MTILFLSLRNIFLQRKRYMLIFIAILLGFSTITIIHASAFGALETLKAKAARYFAGHISVTGYKNGLPFLTDPDGVLKLIKESDLPLRTVSSRTVYFSDVSLFFAGDSIRQRRLIGIDFDAEQNELKNLDFLDGSIENMVEHGKKGILISEAAADILGARVGDDVMIFLTTRTNQYNTATLYVQGIFRETSLFGYVAYMQKEDLNQMILREPDFASDIAIYAEDGVDHEKLLHDISSILDEKYEVLPYMPSKAALNHELSLVDWSKGPILAPLTLNAHLDEITTLLDAFLGITWFVLSLFILIVMIGILNTYRVIVYERTNEIGIMRAMGMSRNSVRGMFLVEAGILALISSITGFFLSLVLIKLLGYINISGFPGAGMFTERGLLKMYIDIRMVTLTLFIMTAAVVIAAVGPAHKASCITPVEALRTNE